jgi:uncharacterized membrane protein
MRRAFILGCLLCPALLSLPVAVAVAQDSEAVEVVETVGVVELVDADAGTGAAPSLDLPQIAGRMHPAMVHLPIGFLLLLAAFELLALIGKPAVPTACRLTAQVLTALAALPAVATGFLRSSELWATREPPAVLVQHRTIMLAVFGFVLASLAVRLIYRNRLNGPRRLVHLLFLFAAAAIVGVGGHLGGKMVHGEQFLPF